MKKLLISAFAVCTIAVSGGMDVRAADMPVKAAPLVRAGCAQFGGPFVGVHGGWAYYDHRWNDRDAWSGESSDDLQRSNVNSTKSGFLGGVQGGYNWQRNCTLFGVVADYSWTSIRNSTLETDGADPLHTLTIESRLRGLGTLRARTGIIVDDLLLYVTGGIAVANFRRTYTQAGLLEQPDPDPAIFASETFSYSRTRWGWTTGVGSEWAWNNNWSIVSEVLFTRFGSDERAFVCAVLCTPPSTRRFDNQDTVWTSKIGINYRWGGH
jgi:outer membrane immunogenic protein